MILKGDCIEVMKAMKPSSVDAIVTDPPYGLEFMGKQWDKIGFSKRRGNQDDFHKRMNREHGTCPYTSGSPEKYVAGKDMQLWHTQWLTEAYRVLKPGGSMLVMGGTRTSHRLACAIEDSGFIIKDTLMWIYGSGFPKAQDLGKMIDKRMGKLENQSIGFSVAGDDGRKAKLKQTLKYRSDYGYEYKNDTDLAKHWDGFKVGGIKPAYEPIIWAVKPPEGSYIDNVLKWGVGAVNVDECRVGADPLYSYPNGAGGCKSSKFHYKGRAEKPAQSNSKGRFPANVILSHHPDCVQVGMKKVKQAWSDKGVLSVDGFNPGQPCKEKPGRKVKKHCDSDGFETVESWNCHPECAVRLLDEQSGMLSSGENPKRRSSAVFKNCYGEFQGQENCLSHYSRGANSGGASRFFYCAKASRGERNAGLEGMEEKSCSPYEFNDDPKFRNPDGRSGDNKTKNNHPTVKPIKLFEYLIKLVTREGQIILDPFIGSGTTGIAAHNAGRKCVGIEKEEEYIEIAKRRATYWRSRPRQLEMTVG